MTFLEISKTQKLPKNTQKPNFHKMKISHIRGPQMENKFRKQNIVRVEKY